MKKIRTGAICIWLIILSGIIISLFRQNEWLYFLPTPVPQNYKPVNTGTEIDISKSLPFKSGKPVFLHFFNPDCPCSRFNVPHFKLLVRKYGEEVNFAIVVRADKKYTVKQIQDRFSLDLPVVFDNSLAVLCGVYSTPQAVILDNNHQLFYRGNYNRSRYCTDEKSNYAEIALDGLLKNNRNLIFSQFALQAYGCKLPNCIKQ